MFFLLLLLLYPLAISSAVVIVIERFVMSQVQSVVDAVTAQLERVSIEISEEINYLRNAIEDTDVDVDLSGLQFIADTLDAIVPDAVVEAGVDLTDTAVAAGADLTDTAEASSPE